MVSALSGVVAEHGVVPVTVIWNEDARHTMVQRDNGVTWGVAEAAADGVVIRDVRDCILTVRLVPMAGLAGPGRLQR
ncbi:hypothetical protein ACFWVF_23650 [Streptomyces sp. NPDC058659]|uniref:hypothetical protein n=1 Tax=unclassified Streptomyces TaxID=2593676 RepID=UPI003652AF3E